MSLDIPVTSSAEMRGDPGENELADLDDDDFARIWAALMDRLSAIGGERPQRSSAGRLTANCTWTGATT